MHALDALGNPFRRAILQELRSGALSVGDLAARFPVSRPAVSRQLRVLNDAGLVEARVMGTRSVYAVRVQGFASVREFLDDFWDVALAKLERMAAKVSSKAAPAHSSRPRRAGGPRRARRDQERSR